MSAGTGRLPHELIHQSIMKPNGTKMRASSFSRVSPSSVIVERIAVGGRSSARVFTSSRCERSARARTTARERRSSIKSPCRRDRSAGRYSSKALVSVVGVNTLSR